MPPAAAPLPRSLQSGSGSSNPYGFACVAGKGAWWTKTTTKGWEIALSDGTAAGTAIVDATSGTSSTLPSGSTYANAWLAAIGSKLYFSCTRNGWDLCS